jgi:hypothetical protein
MDVIDINTAMLDKSVKLTPLIFGNGPYWSSIDRVKLCSLARLKVWQPARIVQERKLNAADGKSISETPWGAPYYHILHPG